LRISKNGSAEVNASAWLLEVASSKSSNESKLVLGVSGCGDSAIVQLAPDAEGPSIV